MSSSTSNSSLARTRSLRSNSLKPASSTTVPTQPAPGPSHITLFLTNLRLLDLDLREDWPDITALTFSTKDAQQKKRIQAVEWALYQLFALWDPEETRNKLQPFYPPLEPLQSLNLRAALLRCLEQVKKTGVLGRDTILRKTMLDECKGERLEEILAVFSNAVLKKCLQELGVDADSIAQRLALENFSYTGERTVLSTLILAHKASLRKFLLDKNETRAQFDDFSDLLNLNDRRIARRHEQLKQAIEESGTRDDISEGEIRQLQDLVQKNWSGSEEWLETLLYGDTRARRDGLLGARFDAVWKHVENGTIGDIEGKQHVGLVEQLDARVRDQEARLARWQAFGKTLLKPGPVSPSKQKEPVVRGGKKIDLGFDKHQSLQVGRNTEKTIAPSSASTEEYTRLVENMRSELADVGKPQTAARPARQSLPPQTHRAMSSPIQERQNPPTEEEEWSSASDTEEPSPGSKSHIVQSTPQTLPMQTPVLESPSEITHNIPHENNQQVPSPRKKTNISINTTSLARGDDKASRNDDGIGQKERAASPPPLSRTPPPIQDPPAQSIDTDSADLANQILNSVSASSPSPKKARHTLSLAERTRLSMSRASHSKYSDLHDDVGNLADLTRLSIRTKPTQTIKSAPVDDEEKHADLIERTRKSMAGLEAAQKKAQIERRRSVKDAKKKQRESSYFPKVEEESVTPSINPVELIDGDPDMESVFKSRPKIKTSPAVSPTRIWEDEGED